jgi:hypothetical protein
MGHVRVSVEGISSREGAIPELLRALREAMVEHNVFRGRVISLSAMGSVVFPAVPRIDRDAVVLPDGTLERLEHDAISIAEHIVLEDVDLIAAERTMPGSHGVLFELLNQLEGLAEDSDLLVVLTTNRPDLIEPALAARPGRVDLALELPLPDEHGRRRLLGLYSGQIELDGDTERMLVERSEGATGALIKELMRQATLRGAVNQTAPTSADVASILDELLHERAALTRRLLGQPPGDDGPPIPPPEEMTRAFAATGLPMPYGLQAPPLTQYTFRSRGDAASSSAAQVGAAEEGDPA